VTCVCVCVCARGGQAALAGASSSAAHCDVVLVEGSMLYALRPLHSHVHAWVVFHAPLRLCAPRRKLRHYEPVAELPCYFADHAYPSALALCQALMTDTSLPGTRWALGAEQPLDALVSSLLDVVVRTRASLQSAA
jgi:hypothetical protein